MYPRFENFAGNNSSRFIDPFGNQYWFSYQTLIAFRPIGQDLFIRENEWSTTTGKHLNAIDSDKKKRLSRETFKATYENYFGNLGEIMPWQVSADKFAESIKGV